MSSSRALLVTALSFAVVQTSAAAPVPVTVGASTAIYNADDPNAVAAGVPVPITIPTATTSFTFTLGIPGQTITVNGGQDFNDADGQPVTPPVPQNVRANNATTSALPPASTNSGTRTLSGITAPGAGYITGVFLGANQVAKPAAVNYTVVGTNLTSYAPALQQVFYIGDGLTGDGSGIPQTFFVPTGAVMLFLGISDANNFDGAPSAYGDNFGSFFGSITFATGAVPEPGALALLAIGLIACGLGRRRR